MAFWCRQENDRNKLLKYFLSETTENKPTKTTVAINILPSNNPITNRMDAILIPIPHYRPSTKLLKDRSIMKSSLNTSGHNIFSVIEEAQVLTISIRADQMKQSGLPVEDLFVTRYMTSSPVRFC